MRLVGSITTMILFYFNIMTIIDRSVTYDWDSVRFRHSFMIILKCYLLFFYSFNFPNCLNQDVPPSPTLSTQNYQSTCRSTIHRSETLT